MVKSVETRAAAEAVIEALRLRAAGSRSIGDAVNEYLISAIDRGLAPTTTTRIEYHLRRVLHLADNRDRPLTWLRMRGAELYEASRARAAADTHRNGLSNAKAFGAWCMKRGWLRENPFAKVEPTGRRRAGRGKPQLRIDESRKLVDLILELCVDGAKPEPVAVLVALLLGSRATEVVTRQVRDLDDGGRLLWIPDSKTDSGRRTLEVPEVLRPLLLELAHGRGGDAPLFLACGRRGARKASRYWLYYHCHALCARAGVPTIAPHGLRRSHSSIARGAGATGELVAAQLGHGSVAVQARSYVAPGAAQSGEAATVLRVLQGGRP